MLDFELADLCKGIKSNLNKYRPTENFTVEGDGIYRLLESKNGRK